MKLKIIAFVTLILMFLVWLQPINLGKVEITIPKGANGRAIVEYLSDDHVVRDVSEFLFWLKITGKEKYLKSGTYELSKYKNPVYLIDILTRGGKSDIIVTIPEGLTIHETADILAIKGLINKEHFINLCTDQAFIRKLELNISTLEGYLFPDTYSFSTAQTDTAIIKTLIVNFNHHLKGLDLSNPDSVNKILILASLVEKEARYEDERPIIARVFINRLRTNRPLESCATVFYVLKSTRPNDYQNKDIHKTKLTEKDLKINSPYNTYLNLGLPPSPICSPGYGSLKAVIAPADVDYLYFVAKGDGHHYFSKTYREHLQAKEYYNEKK